MKNKLYYIYIMRCSDNSLYTGITTDIERRFFEHMTRKGKGAKYTRAKIVTEIAAAWSTKEGRSAASKLEAYLKKLRKEKKELLIKCPEKLYEIYEGQEIFTCENTGRIPIR